MFVIRTSDLHEQLLAAYLRGPGVASGRVRARQA